MRKSLVPEFLLKAVSGARNFFTRPSGRDVPRQADKPKTDPNLLDIFDLAAVGRFLLKQDQAMLAWTPQDSETSESGAARMVLGLLRDNDDLRRKFPTALSDGPYGPYFRWLSRNGARKLKLSPQAIGRIRAAFLQPPGDRVLHIYLQLPGLHESHRLAVTPAGGKSFVKWLLKEGRRDHGLRDDEILWFLHQAAENPWPLLTVQYLIQPDWQNRFPCALTAAGIGEWKEWLEKEHRLAPLRLSAFPPVLRPIDELRLLHRHRAGLQSMAPQPWLMAGDFNKLVKAAQREVPKTLLRAWRNRLADDRATAIAGKPGVNLIGHFSYPSGLQRAACMIAEALETGGYRVSRRDLPAGLRSDTLARVQHLGLESFDITVSVAVPSDPLEKLYKQSGLTMRPGVHRIGVWYWELDQPPADWIERAASMQELWAPSRFIANAMWPVMPVPVFEMPPGVDLPRPAKLPRATYGLKDDEFVFLFMFDMCSIMERKNPLGLIRAFQSAFPDRPGVSLVIKVLRGNTFPDDFRRLQAVCQEAGVSLLDKSMSQEETQGLLNHCDAYVSLHRSEGFGLTMAEAMLLGKPVIATNYSGNTDFMNSGNSLLVDYELTPITNDSYFYSKGNRWAEPSTEDAAAKMRWVFEHQDEARALGEKARVDATMALSLEAASRRMTARIEQIRAAGRGTSP